MTILEAIILGIIQGVTEFLPLSSSGHLVLLSNFFGINGDFIFFSVIVHFATLLSVIVYFRKDIWFLIKHPFSREVGLLILATIPTVIIVLLFQGFIESTFNGSLLPFSFIFTAILLLITHFFSIKNECQHCYKQKKISKTQVVLMGAMQGIAVIPGISRSGATICTGIISGVEKNESARFSFLMSIPIILASMFYEIFKLIKNGGGQIFPLQTFIAFIVAFLVGLGSVKLMMLVVKKIQLFWFSIYLFIIAIVAFFFV